MIKYKLISILLICWNLGNCQFFEGELKYEVHFHFNNDLFEDMGISKDEIIKKLKDDNEYFEKVTILIKDDNYVKEIHSANPKKLIYIGSSNFLYTFEKNSEVVPIIDTQYENLSNFTREEPTITISDSTKLISGDTCNLIKISWGNHGDEFYWYNSNKLKINPKLYKGHQFENLDKILQISDSYPIEINKTIGKHISIQMTLKEIKNISLSESNFSIPELEELSKREMRNSPTIRGVKFMKKKN